MAAAKLYLTFAHVEADLRRFQRRMPEDLNRVFAEHGSNVESYTCSVAVRNLRSVAMPNGVFEVGDVMCDAMLHFRVLPSLALGFSLGENRLSG